MRREYEAIAAAGFILQVDSPDLAQRSYNYPDLSTEEWRKVVARNVEAINAATKSIPREQIRVHVCWGANEGPHNHDTELAEIVGELIRLRASAHSPSFPPTRGMSTNGGCGRRSSCPTDVAYSRCDRFDYQYHRASAGCCRPARALRAHLGRDRIIAGVDCGFGTIVVERPKVDPAVAGRSSGPWWKVRRWQAHTLGID